MGEKSTDESKIVLLPRPILKRLLAFEWDPLEWSTVDRCLLVAALMLPFSVGFWLIDAWFLRAPALAPYYDFRFLRGFQTAMGGFIAMWLAVVGFGLWLRRRRPESKVLLHATIQLYSIGNAVGAFCVGPVTSPHLIVLVGGAAFALFLFETRAVVLGMISAAVTMLTGVVAMLLGWVSYAPLLAAPPYLGGRVATWWVGQMAVAAAAAGIAILALFAYLVARLRDRERRLVRITRTDPLTGVANRRHFLDVFTRELERARRYGTPLSCVILDLDHFKQVNDAHGHLVGDRVLVAAADAFRASVRAHDLLARWGGEEFVVLLPQTDLAGAEALAERCRRSLEETLIESSGVRVRATVSIGVATHPTPPASTGDELLRRADEALYRAKRQGRNRVASMPPPSETVSDDGTEAAGP